MAFLVDVAFKLFEDDAVEEKYETPFGDLEDNDLDTAQILHHFFYDMVNDGGEFDYPKARLMYAHPSKFLKKYIEGDLEDSDENNGR